MCTKLCKLLKTIEENDVKNEDFKSALFQIKHNFEKQSNRVFNLLSNFKDNHQSAPYLSQLLLRIDYNNYFTELGEIVMARMNR